MKKKTFLHRNSMPGKLKKATGAGLLAACLCLLAASCTKNNDNILPSPEKKPQTEEKEVSVPLSFSVTLEGNPLPDKIEKETIGLFITKDGEGGGDVFPGSGNNLQAVLTKANGQETWKYFSKTGEEITELKGTVGKKIRVLAYLPYNPDADAQGIPFDISGDMGSLTSSTGLLTQLYNKEPKQTASIPANGQIALDLWQTDSQIFLKIRNKPGNKPSNLEKVSIVNLQGGEWIKVQGKVNPATGELLSGSAKAGEIFDGTRQSLSERSDGNLYDFSVPPFMDAKVEAGQIGFQVMVDGKKTLFTLGREQLNSITQNGVQKYGFARGYQNTYELVYNEKLSKPLQLVSWDYLSPEGDHVQGAVPEPEKEQGTVTEPEKKAYQPWLFEAKEITAELPATAKAKAPLSSHLYESYLTDQYRKNNGVAAAIWDSSAEGNPDTRPQEERFGFIWFMEPPRSPIVFASKDAQPTPVQWKKEDLKTLPAKDLCKNYREGGFTNWRLPRMSEWYMLAKILQSEPSKITPPNEDSEIPGTHTYWSGTEQLTDKTLAGNHDVECVTLSINGTSVEIKGSLLPAQSTAMVRCVRDEDPQ